MLSSHSTLRKSVAVTLPICLMWLMLGCVAICSHRLEESSKADTHCITAFHTDEDCPITAASASVLLERSFLSPVTGGAVGLATPAHLVELTPNSRSAHQTWDPSSSGPPCERLSILRI